MKTSTAAAAIATALLTAPVGSALADKTTGEFPACGKPFWLEAMLEFQDNGSTQRYDRWINHGKCIQLREGLEVEIVRYYGDAKSKRVEFEINGYRFFTVRKAIARSL
ncbi:hypothetical protein [Halofilum ochraceum]|uniref:hypothetical protein n=1 Tax=Halofilum ochraceum TaxID=1611323 RepID=UPI000832272C|nr:hypothetical protein [Halofilum ochraceum]